MDFGDSDVDMGQVKNGHALLLGFGHTNSALYRLRHSKDDALRNHVNVIGALEKKMYNCRRWSKSMPRDAAVWIASENNSEHLTN